MKASEIQQERLRQMNIFNYGYDDENGEYKTVVNDHIGYRYKVIKILGAGSFGQALQCFDH
jgi:dual specificity tyrosine-phosphorylation-regulated kinase 2/3/4